MAQKAKLVGGPCDGDVAFVPVPPPARVYAKWCSRCKEVHWWDSVDAPPDATEYERREDEDDGTLIYAVGGLDSGPPEVSHRADAPRERELQPA